MQVLFGIPSNLAQECTLFLLNEMGGIYRDDPGNSRISTFYKDGYALECALQQGDGRFLEVTLRTEEEVHFEESFIDLCKTLLQKFVVRFVTDVILTIDHGSDAVASTYQFTFPVVWVGEVPCVYTPAKGPPSSETSFYDLVERLLQQGFIRAVLLDSGKVDVPDQHQSVVLGGQFFTQVEIIGRGVDGVFFAPGKRSPGGNTAVLYSCNYFYFENWNYGTDRPPVWHRYHQGN